MTTLPGRPNGALMVVDVQNGVMDRAYDRDRIIANISALVQRARAESVPVVWVQHTSDELVPGTEPWRYVPELVPGDGEPLIHKRYGDSFEDTDLEQILAERGVGRIVLSGAQTDACIRSTAHGAFVRGYDVTLVTDAHTTEDLSMYGAPPPDQVISHTNLYWSGQDAPGRQAGAVPTDDVSFAP
jgi:nicotinamidase-related amidase